MSLAKVIASIAITLCCVLLVWYTLPLSTEPPGNKEVSQDKREPSEYLHDTSVKTILLWNNFFEYKHMGFDHVGKNVFEEFQCQVTNCYIWDYLDATPVLPVEDFDLVWFHGMDVPKGTLLRNKPPKRKPHQRYFFYLMESPSVFHFDLLPLNGFFNWTGTYRRDSDIYRPYQMLTEKLVNTQYYTASDRAPIWLAPEFSDLTNISDTKTKLVSWVVSNCVKIPSNRDVYVTELSQYINIDIYGACGEPCGEHCTDEILEKNYKFYLAFENSLCEDYVTEKFYRTLRLEVVPIVLGGANYRNVAPPMSYIDTNDYDTPADLADYLLYLDKNPVEYQKYFWWKKYYNVNGTNVLCQMCEMLNDPELPVKVYDDLEGWWNGPGVCKNGSGVDLSTWASRVFKNPVQTFEYSFVLLITNTNYSVILFVFLSLVVTSYCIVVLIIKMCIKRTMRNSSQIRYENFSKVL